LAATLLLKVPDLICLVAALFIELLECGPFVSQLALERPPPVLQRAIAFVPPIDVAAA
jgi:hypothetical protein